jgi:hypothetical protein
LATRAQRSGCDQEPTSARLPNPDLARKIRILPSALEM